MAENFPEVSKTLKINLHLETQCHGGKQKLKIFKKKPEEKERHSTQKIFS